MSAERPRCGTCSRPQRNCLCQWVRPTEVDTEVVILQHPAEVAHAKNTGLLLHLSLPNSRLLVGEVWSAQAWTDAGLTSPPTWLLYPRAASDPAPLGDFTVNGPAQNTPRNCLVVLDATWRKSRKMLHLSPWLQGLPRLALTDAPASRYTIRKAHRAGQLSTLEATCAALSALEGESAGDRLAPLLSAFDGFVAQQQAWVPALMQ